MNGVNLSTEKNYPSLPQMITWKSALRIFIKAKQNFHVMGPVPSGAV